jgi:hypothetical protein
LTVSRNPANTITRHTELMTPATVRMVRRRLRVMPRNVIRQRVGIRPSGGSSRSATLTPPRTRGGKILIASAGLIRDAARAGAQAASADAAAPATVPTIRLLGYTDVARSGSPIVWVYWAVYQPPRR